MYITVKAKSFHYRGLLTIQMRMKIHINIIQSRVTRSQQIFASQNSITVVLCTKYYGGYFVRIREEANRNSHPVCMTMATSLARWSPVLKFTIHTISLHQRGVISQLRYHIVTCIMKHKWVSIVFHASL